MSPKHKKGQVPPEGADESVIKKLRQLYRAESPEYKAEQQKKIQKIKGKHRKQDNDN